MSRGSVRSGRGAGAPPGGGRRHRVLSDIARDYQLHLIIALPVIWFIVFRYIPMYGAQIAFRDYVVTKGIWKSPWVGLAQFAKFLNAYAFWDILRNTVFLSIYTIAATFPIPIILALAINNARSPKFRKTVQLIVYAPYFISTVVMVSMIIQFLSPTLGLVSGISQLLGRPAVGLMGRPESFRSIYVWSHVWQYSGFGTVIYLAALSGVDPQLHEAAIIDGASRVQRTWHVDVPSILPTIVIIFVLTMGQVMNVGFEKVFLMQNPLNTENSEVIQTYVYKIGLTGIPNFSYASAIGLFNSFINFVLILVSNTAVRRLGGGGLW
jgi:putative aldouronate transport system permease protein